MISAFLRGRAVIIHSERGRWFHLRLSIERSLDRSPPQSKLLCVRHHYTPVPNIFVGDGLQLHFLLYNFRSELDEMLKYRLDASMIQNQGFSYLISNQKWFLIVFFSHLKIFISDLHFRSYVFFCGYFKSEYIYNLTSHFLFLGSSVFYIFC